MMKQFFGKPYFVLLALSAAMFGDAVLSYTFGLGELMLALYFVATLVLAYKRLEWALVFAFLELFTNPHGKLLFATVAGQTVPLRMTIFAAILLAWFVLFLQKRVRPDWQRLTPFLVLLVGVSLGFVGMLVNPPVDAFQDGNAYLYLFYLLPILSVVWTSETKRLLLQCLAAGATWVTLLSFGCLYLYTHFTEWQLEPVYLFLRDVRIAEITNVTSSLYRVFIQSQFFVIVFAMMCVGWLFEPISRRTRFSLVLMLAPAIAVFVLGLSRSFWFGFFLAMCTFLVLLLGSLRPRMKEFFAATGASFLSVLLAGFLLIAVIIFPIPNRSSEVNLGDALKQRTSSDVAISSRWKLLDPMLETIKRAPLLGNGFGTTVSFQTDDPRVRSINPDGSWITYSMEWGWLELWLKMGVFGPLGFLLLGIMLARAFVIQLATQQRWLAVGFLLSLTFLYGTHTFSPYLNHPIGLGFLLFAAIFAGPTFGQMPLLVREPKTVETKKTVVAALTSDQT